MKALRDSDRAGFIPYLTAGDPSIEWTEEYIRILAEAGADVVEIGVPFSDPVADGPVNQRSSERALRNGVTLRAVLDLVARVRSGGCVIPIVLFTYYNPLLRTGVATFARRASHAGADGALVLDLPVEEADAYRAAMRESRLDTVFLAAPTSTPERLQAIDQRSTAFVYYVSRLGVTGMRDQLPVSLGVEIRRLRSHVSNPIAVGFGISTADQAAAVAVDADAVVMGSVLVRFIEEYDPAEAGRRIGELAQETVRKLKQARRPRAQEAV